MKKYLLPAIMLLTSMAFSENLKQMSTAASKASLDAYKAQMVISTGAEQANSDSLRISTPALQSQIDGLYGTSQRFYLGSTAYLGSQYFGTSVTAFTPEVAYTKAITGTTDIIISSYIIDLGAITTIPAGEWKLEFYATVPSGVVQKNFSVWNGSGTECVGVAGYLIAKSADSSPLSSVKSEDSVSVTTNTITAKSKVLTLVTYGKRTSGGASITLTYYRGGLSDAHLTMPVSRADVSVTKNAAGAGISVSPASGVGDVTVSVSSNIAVIVNSNGHAAGEVYGICPSSHDFIKVASGGSSTDNVDILAKSFKVCGSTNNASVQPIEYEVTYNGFISSFSAYYIVLPEAKQNNFVMGQAAVADTYNDGEITAYLTVCSSGVSEGDAWIEMNISTNPFIGVWETHSATVTLPSGTFNAPNVVGSITFTPTTFSAANNNFYVTIGRNRQDSSVQTVYISEIKFSYTKN